jgi:hypothetical protein
MNMNLRKMIAENVQIYREPALPARVIDLERLNLSFKMIFHQALYK